MKTTKAILVLAGALCLLFYPATSKADTLYFYSDHITGTYGKAGPFGEVVLTQNGANVDVKVQLYDNSLFVRTPAGDDMDFKFNGIGIAVTDIVDTSGKRDITGATGTFNGDGTGNFAFGVYFTTQLTGGDDRTDNAFYPTNYDGALYFTVNDALISDLLVVNNKGNIFVADVYSGVNQLTGPIDVSVPEPGILILLGIAMSAIGAASYYVRKI